MKNSQHSQHFYSKILPNRINHHYKPDGYREKPNNSTPAPHLSRQPCASPPKSAAEWFSLQRTCQNWRESNRSSILIQPQRPAQTTRQIQTWNQQKNFGAKLEEFMNWSRLHFWYKVKFQSVPRNWFPTKQTCEKCTGSVGADEKASRTRRYL